MPLKVFLILFCLILRGVWFSKHFLVICAWMKRVFLEGSILILEQYLLGYPAKIILIHLHIVTQSNESPQTNENPKNPNVCLSMSWGSVGLKSVRSLALLGFHTGFGDAVSRAPWASGGGGRCSIGWWDLTFSSLSTGRPQPVLCFVMLLCSREKCIPGKWPREEP